MDKRIAIYPGSFNPWHEGHSDILNKALQLFDEVIIAVGINPEKEEIKQKEHKAELTESITKTLFKEHHDRVVVQYFDGLLVDFAQLKKASAIIRGLRNGNDLQYEMNQQYWNEDLGLKIPMVYFITDRRIGHISSSAIRQLKKFTKWSKK